MKHSMIARALFTFTAMMVSLTACEVETFEDGVSRFNAGNPPLPPPPPPPAPPPPPPPPPTFGATFSEIQANVFTPSCATAGCHAGAGAEENLNLEASNSYAELVGVPSVQDATLLRVEALDPDNSYLIRKLEGTAAGGDIMPPTAMLPQTSIDTVRMWISNGAIDDRVVAPGPVKVTSLSPAPNAILQAPPTQLVAGFDRELNITSVNNGTFILQASGGDGTFADGNETAIAAGSGGISVPAMNPQSAVFDLNGVALADDAYRVRLVGAGASVIQDLDNNALDGEFGGTFPSGNGAAGGDFVAGFSITTPVVIGPTLDQIQAIVFGPSCATAGCHTGAGAQENLNLSDAGTSFAELVGVASQQQPAVLLVAPNDPDNSYLIRKLEGTAGITGSTMPPPPRPAIAAGDIAEIRNWIAGGALLN